MLQFIKLIILNMYKIQPHNINVFYVVNKISTSDTNFFFVLILFPRTRVR